MAQHAIEPVEEDGHDAVAQRGLGRGVEFPACEDGVGIVARGGEIWRGRREFEVGEVGVEVRLDGGHQGGAFCVGHGFGRGERVVEPGIMRVEGGFVGEDDVLIGAGLRWIAGCGSLRAG